MACGCFEVVISNREPRMTSVNNNIWNWYVVCLCTETEMYGDAFVIYSRYDYSCNTV